MWCLTLHMVAAPLSFRRTLRLGGLNGTGAADNGGKLVRGQAHRPHKADDLRVLQRGALFLQFGLPRLQLRDPGGVLLILRIDFFDFRFHIVTFLS